MNVILTSAEELWLRHEAETMTMCVYIPNYIANNVANLLIQFYITLNKSTR